MVIRPFQDYSVTVCTRRGLHFHVSVKNTVFQITCHAPRHFQRISSLAYHGAASQEPLFPAPLPFFVSLRGSWAGLMHSARVQNLLCLFRSSFHITALQQRCWPAPAATHLKWDRADSG